MKFSFRAGDMSGQDLGSTQQSDRKFRLLIGLKFGPGIKQRQSPPKNQMGHERDPSRQ